MAYKITNKCENCGACADACPVSAISAKGKKHEIDPDTCIGCGCCENTCPFGAIEGE